MSTPPNVTLRDAEPQDREFAYQARKIALVAQGSTWAENEERRLHDRRFDERRYRIVQVAGQDIGILATSTSVDELRLNQIYLLPDHQGQGVGTWCLEIVQSEARALGVPVWLRVRKANARARALYVRLGFTECGESATHVMLECGR